MKESVQDRAIALIEPISNALGYVLVEVLYRKERDGSMSLNVCIDKDGGVDINDCERLSKALDEPLDINDITDGASYVLNVSSYGLDRALKTDYDFNKHLNQEIVIKFYKPWNGTKEIKAILTAYDKETITVMFDKEVCQIDKKDTALIQKYIQF